MARANRLISVERGHDPRDFALVCFGGAGGLHAADLADSLGIPKVIVPRFPGALSALGLLLADARKDYSKSLLADANATETMTRIQRAVTDLSRIGTADLSKEGFMAGRGRKAGILTEAFVDARYRGQSYELTIPFRKDFVKRFHQQHAQRYGYANPGMTVEIVTVRVSATGHVAKPRLATFPKTSAKAKPIETRGQTAIFARDDLRHGHVIGGPAIVGEYSSTTRIPRGFRCTVDAWLNLVIER
jgi:N-methylhydantoinase A